VKRALTIVLLGCCPAAAGPPTAPPNPDLPGAAATADTAIEVIQPPPPAPLPPPAEPPPPVPAAGRPDGASCTTADQCSGGVCEGEGCGPDEGRCASTQRMCTRDFVKYCGCDGTEFGGSGSCPGKRFSKRGPCQITPGVMPTP
jgi:hypothetical protein